MFQGDCDDVVLWSHGAGLSRNVPVCGLWGEHHLPARSCAGLPISSEGPPGNNNVSVLYVSTTLFIVSAFTVSSPEPASRFGAFPSGLQTD